MNQKLLMVLLIFLVYGISKGESMDHVALGNFDMEKEHAVYPYDESEPYISISNEYKENLISELDIRNGESITSDIDGGDDYWDFVNILLRIPSMLYPARGVPI